MTTRRKDKPRTLRSVIINATERELKKMADDSTGTIDNWPPVNLASWLWRGILADVERNFALTLLPPKGRQGNE